jgi:transcriptional regulator with GAF, ATPase, and Fis domain
VVEAESLRRLTQYSWPGNIRELENIIERALILSSTPVLRIEPDLLNIEGHYPMPSVQEAAMESAPLSANPGSDLDSIQREHILNVLREVHWVIEGSDGAAVRLGLKPGTLRHRMKKLRITRSKNSLS